MSNLVFAFFLIFGLKTEYNISNIPQNSLKVYSDSSVVAKADSVHYKSIVAKRKRKLGFAFLGTIVSGVLATKNGLETDGYPMLFWIGATIFLLIVALKLRKPPSTKELSRKPLLPKLRKNKKFNRSGSTALFLAFLYLGTLVLSLFYPVLSFLPSLFATAYLISFLHSFFGDHPNPIEKRKQLAMAFSSFILFLAPIFALLVIARNWGE